MDPEEGHDPPARARTRAPGEGMKWPPEDEQQVHRLV